MTELLGIAMAFWPFGAGALIARSMTRGQHWIALAGVAIAIAVAVNAYYTAPTDDGYFLLPSTQVLLIGAAIWWGFLWLAGVGLGWSLARARGRAAANGTTASTSA